MTADTNQPDLDDEQDAELDAATEDGAAEDEEDTEDATAEEAEDQADEDEDEAESESDTDTQQLLARFRQSPEAEELGGVGGWAGLMVEYARDDLGVIPAEMTPENLREVVFRLFPQKVTALASEAPIAIRELHAFWQFMEREGAAPNAAANLALLDDKAARRLEIAMSNPANYSPTKAMMMAGLARGQDLSTEAGVDAWRQIYEAEQQAGRSTMPFGLPGAGLGLPAGGGETPDLGLGDLGETTSTGGGSHRKSPSKAQQKAKRKMVKASQRKNRKK